MIYVFLIFVLLFVMFKVSDYLKSFSNPYKLYMVFGKKGSGKTTLLTKLAVKYMKQGKHVYSTVRIPGVRYFDVQKVGDYVFPENSVVFVDEVGIIWDNRNFKNFRNEVRNYFKFQRQYKNIVYLFSQTFDVDLKLRNLTDGMYLCKSYGGVLSIAFKIVRNITLVESTAESESRIADNLEFEPIINLFFGGEPIIMTWIPNYIKYFKSYDPPALPLMPYDDLSSLPERKVLKKQVPVDIFIEDAAVSSVASASVPGVKFFDLKKVFFSLKRLKKR